MLDVLVGFLDGLEWNLEGMNFSSTDLHDCGILQETRQRNRGFKK